MRVIFFQRVRETKYRRANELYLELYLFSWTGRNAFEHFVDNIGTSCIDNRKRVPAVNRFSQWDFDDCSATLISESPEAWCLSEEYINCTLESTTRQVLHQQTRIEHPQGKRTRREHWNKNTSSGLMHVYACVRPNRGSSHVVNPKNAEWKLLLRGKHAPMHLSRVSADKRCLEDCRNVSPTRVGSAGKERG